MQKPSIMIVEDDKLYAQEMKLRLEEQGYDVCGVHSAACNIIQEYTMTKPDLVLMDIELKGDVDGIYAASQIHEIDNVPIIFISACLDDEKLQGAIATGNCAYLVKPVNFKTLKATIALALENKYVNTQNSQVELDKQMNSLAEANVRMVLLTDLIISSKESEHEFFLEKNFDNYFEKLLDGLQTVTQSEYAAFGMFSQGGVLSKFITLGLSAADKDKIKDYPQGKGLLNTFFHKGVLMRVDDIAAHPDSCGFPVGHPPMDTLMGGPIRFQGRVGGVIYLANKRTNEKYTLNDENILQVFITIIESTMDRFYLLDDLQHKQLALQQEKENNLAVIKQLQDAQEQLLQSEKLASIGQLAAGVAHEINNPVGYINSNISSLKRYVSDVFQLLDVYEKAESSITDESIKTKLAEVKKNIEIEYLRDDLQDLIGESEEGVVRVKQIVQDLKDFSHVDEAEWQWADLHQGLDSTLNIVRNEIKYKAEVKKEYGSLPEVECIISQLNQVFMNILVNAAHAIEEHGTITIRTGADDSNAWVEIEDNGKGMDVETSKRIFDPFFTTKPVGTGTGLGLSLSYGIVQKHGGEITVNSDIGKGTCFHIKLPIKQTEQDKDTAVS